MCIRDRAKQGQSVEQMQQQEEKKAQMAEMRESILSQIMTPDARQRLSRIKLAKPEKAQQIESQLIMSAQKGMIQDKISEQQLIGLLEKMSGTKQETKIQIKRKGFGGIDDDF
eukprot:TRINITY_DN2451_c0_g1_i2.p2 TRINITY_DN2451_c0_g1~~TRINITY_DN2451_c0_g1_i2.p2  ORF type:complete len:113 (-),score=29.90 TRINITY_DN2451_c0_g1_i2:75-413(-)